MNAPKKSPEFYPVSACVDCVVAIANDDYTGMDNEREAEVRAALEKHEYAYGGEELGFSWAPCGVCGSRLGGDRTQVFEVERPQPEELEEDAR